MLDVGPQLFQLLSDHQTKSRCPNEIIVDLTRKTMTKKVKLANPSGDAMTRKEGFYGTVEFTSNVIA